MLASVEVPGAAADQETLDVDSKSFDCEDATTLRQHFADQGRPGRCKKCVVCCSVIVASIAMVGMLRFVVADLQVLPSLSSRFACGGKAAPSRMHPPIRVAPIRMQSPPDGQPPALGEINSGSASELSNVVPLQTQDASVPDPSLAGQGDGSCADEAERKRVRNVMQLPSPTAIVTAFLLALGASVSRHSGEVDWRYFAAGGIGSAVSHAWTTPIDVVKTRMQTNPELYDGKVTKAFVDITRTEGPLFLLQGLGPTFWGYGIEGALKFGSYDTLKLGLVSLLHFPATWSFVLASVIAGAVAAVVLCPAEDVRIRLVADPKYAPNSMAAFVKMMREEGIASPFRGYTAMLAKQIPYTITKQVCFDSVTSVIKAFAPIFILRKFPMILTFLSSVIVAVLAAFASHPGDMLLTEAFKGYNKEKPKRTRQLLKDIIKERGVKGLLLGIKARIGHCIAIVTPQLVIYDVVKQFLGLPATGGHHIMMYDE